MRPARFSNSGLDVSRVLVPALTMAAALMLAMPGTAHADEAANAELPRCEPATLGATACMGGISCECVQVRGGSVTGELSGVKWNCDALQWPTRRSPVEVSSHRQANVIPPFVKCSRRSHGPTGQQRR